MATERDRTTEAGRRTVQVGVAKAAAGGTSLIVRARDGWIEIGFRSAPNAAQVRALHWLEDDGMLTLERADGHVRFPENAWLAAGEIPAESASVPRTRELQNAWLRGGDADLLEGSAATFFVISYDTFARYQRELLRRHWASAVMDESQNIKNPDTYRTRAARGLKRSFGICATGTP